MGRSYEVVDLDLGQRARNRAAVQRRLVHAAEEGDRHLDRGDPRAARRAAAWRLSFGFISVTEQVVAYQKKRVADHEVLDLLPVELPEQNFLTQALWYVLPDELLGRLPAVGADTGALHAAEHSQIAVLPLIAMCDRWDIGGLSTNFHPQTGKPTIFIYDGQPRRRGDNADRLPAVRDAGRGRRRLIEECPLRERVPGCVQSPKCGNLNEPLSRRGGG